MYEEKVLLSFITYYLMFAYSFLIRLNNILSVVLKDISKKFAHAERNREI